MEPKTEEARDDEFEVDDGEYTDTDLFDPELIAKELESLRQPGEAQKHSARGRIEDLLERKRLERDLVDFDDDEFSQTLF